MQFISFDEADSLLTWTGVADAIEAGHVLPKAEIGDLLLQSAPNALLTRGAWIEGLGMAIKSMSVFPENTQLSPQLPTIQGGVLLFEGKNGGLKVVIDGILVTKWKTAGDSVLGARLLANPEPKTHVMVGAGTVAASIIDAYHAVFPSIKRFIIYNRTKERAEELAATLSESISGIEVYEDLPEACAEADILTSATMTVDPILRGDWMKPGTHIDLIGAFKPNMREADDDLILKSSLFVDSKDTTFGHIGEIEIPLQAGTISHSDVLGDFYDLCSDRIGRQNEEEITLFKNGGGAHLDLMTSLHIFDRCNVKP
ncbi:MAG: ornithine cyclodeaminase [Rhizobiaceae bacterium]|nr:ornithine cyclodeaminase [Rhizobiaceae bacterium]